MANKFISHWLHGHFLRNSHPWMTMLTIWCFKDVVTATYFEWTRCGDASMMGIYLWSENLAKLTLLCLQHGQHTAGCGDTSMMGLSLWSEN